MNLLRCKSGRKAEHFKYEWANFFDCEFCRTACGNERKWNTRAKSVVPEDAELAAAD